MKKILSIFGIFIFSGCTTKEIVKKDNSIYEQKQNANKAWQEPDKEN